MQGADATQQIGEALKITGFLQLHTAHNRWKTHDFGVGIPLPGNVVLEPLDEIYIQGRARVHAVHAHALEEIIGKRAQRIRRGAIGRHGRISH